MSNNITAIYYTANKAPEMFLSKIRQELLKSLDGIPLISVSQKPIDFGKNICVGDIGWKVSNIYRQALIGAKEAKTDYIALCEDDVLYSPSHFRCIRPKNISYNLNRWNIYTWTNPPIFSHKNRIVLNQLIAPRDKLIEVLENRFKKYPNPDDANDRFWSEPSKSEKIEIGLFCSPEPNIMFSHEWALGYLNLGKRKRMGEAKTDTLPYWGNIREVINKIKWLN